MAVDWIYDSHVMKFLRVVNMKILKETAALQDAGMLSCIINLLVFSFFAFSYIRLPLHVLGSYRDLHTLQNRANTAHT